MSRSDARWVVVAALTWCLAALTVVARQSPAPAYVVRSLDSFTDRRESRPEILDTPVLPGSTMKAVALVAALESGVLEPTTQRMCRRTITVDGRRFTCSHPDLHRPLTAAEALAHSCNDFFASLAPRLPRQALNSVRLAAGLPPIGASVPLGPAILGLDGPRVAPRVLLDVLARLMAVGRDPAVRMRAETRAVLREGLTGAATYGSAALLGERGVSALAKTGTAPMPGGGVEGLIVALTPAERPVRGIVVVAPGAAGADAAGLAAEILRTVPARPATPGGGAASTPTPTPALPSAPPVATPNVSAGPTARIADIRLGVLQANGRVRVETLAIEDYVARVLAGEGQPRAGDAAQQALAIAIRTFALANRHRHRREGFDVCDSTHCQVVRPPTVTTRRAAEATAGRVLLHDGAPAFVFYSAWCGGRSARPSEVWPGADDSASEPLHQDDACAGEPGWTSEITARDLERALRAGGLRGDRLRELRILSMSSSGRVARMRADGFTPNEINAHELRTALGRVVGWQSLKSTAFTLQRTGRGYRFTGRGFGHGVGLCVVGAGHRAAAGATADEILRFYYPGLTLGSAGGDVRLTDAARPTSSTPRAATTAPVPAPTNPPEPSDIQLALPGADATERSVVLSLLRTARAEIAKRAGLSASTTLRVTVHPTVESFGRATGQPWWVSGATVGTSIDLLPLGILRQQGQLERTIRHEVAHALVDPALADRKLWVREGAAFYFAAPDEAAPGSGRPVCPTDVEIARPLSVGAQREAYARAERCFRDAVASGTSWREVK